MEAAPEARADTGELDGGTEEGAAHAAPLGGVVIGAPVRGGVAHGAVGLALVGEFGGDDAAFAQVATVAVELLVEDAEAVALADVQGEVDVPAEDLRQFHGQAVGKTGLLRGLEQGAADGGAGGGEPGVHRQFDELGVEAAVFPPAHLKAPALVGAVDQGLQAAVAAQDLQFVAGHEARQAAGRSSGVEERLHLAGTEAETPEDVVQGVAGADGNVLPLGSLVVGLRGRGRFQARNGEGEDALAGAVALGGHLGGGEGEEEQGEELHEGQSMDETQGRAWRVGVSHDALPCLGLRCRYRLGRWPAS